MKKNATGDDRWRSSLFPFSTSQVITLYIYTEKKHLWRWKRVSRNWLRSLLLRVAPFRGISQLKNAVRGMSPVRCWPGKRKPALELCSIVWRDTWFLSVRRYQPDGAGCAEGCGVAGKSLIRPLRLIQNMVLPVAHLGFLHSNMTDGNAFAVHGGF